MKNEGTMICGAAVSLLVMLGVSCTRPPAPAAKLEIYRSMASSDASIDAQAARDMISSYRKVKGLSPLDIDPELQKWAEEEASRMAKAEQPALAEKVKERLALSGFTSPEANLSAGYHTLAEAFSGWRESPGHNRVMLSPASKMGIATAYAPGAKYKVYWVFLVADR